jgi:hypothetical protein
LQNKRYMYLGQNKEQPHFAAVRAYAHDCFSPPAPG